MKKPTEKGPEARRRDVDKSWFDDMRKERGLSLLDVAKAWGRGNVSFIWRMLTKDRRAHVADAIVWAEILKAPLPLVIQRLGYDVPGLTCPVVGTVGGAARVSVLPPEKLGKVEAPGQTAAGLVALRVDAPHSALNMWHGAHLYYRPSNVVRPDAFGRLSVVELGDHAAPLVGVVDRASVGGGRVRLFGANDEIESEQMISATPIVWQKM